MITSVCSVPSLAGSSLVNLNRWRKADPNQLDTRLGGEVNPFTSGDEQPGRFRRNSHSTDLPVELVERILGKLTVKQASAGYCINSVWRAAFSRHSWWTTAPTEGPRSQARIAWGLCQTSLAEEAILSHPGVIKAQLDEWQDNERRIGHSGGDALREHIENISKMHSKKLDEWSYRSRLRHYGGDYRTLPVCLPWALGNRTLTIDFSGCQNLERLWPVTPRSFRISVLELSGCLKLRQLPEDIGNIKGLYALCIRNNTPITRLPLSLGKCKRFAVLWVEQGPVNCELPSRVVNADLRWKAPWYVEYGLKYEPEYHMPDVYRKRALAEGRVQPDIPFQPE